MSLSSKVAVSVMPESGALEAGRLSSRDTCPLARVRAALHLPATPQ
jgi:hypothetical protein